MRILFILSLFIFMPYKICADKPNTPHTPSYFYETGHKEYKLNYIKVNFPDFYTEKYIHFIDQEDIILKSYKDSLGHLTIGIGILTSEEKTISIEEALSQMKSTIEIYEEELTRCYIPNYPQLPEEKQLALISMYYNLGYYGFKKLGIAKYANRKDWDSVIYFLNKNKLYQKQVPYRFKEIIKLLEK